MRKAGGMNLHFCTHSIFNFKPCPLPFLLLGNTLFEGLYIPAGSNLGRFWCKGLERKKKLVMKCEGREWGDDGGGRGEGAERMGDGLFVHASHSLAVISIGCSIIVPFQGGKKEKKKTTESKCSTQWCFLCRHKVQRGKDSCFDLPCRHFWTNLDTENYKVRAWSQPSVI